ncbi:MAG: hypothetical protein HN389_03925 [Clostridia bacterium]|nr:hypothetical protein [Clostridia bacterium]
MRNINKLLKSKKGSTILTVVIVMVVLVLLGQAITMLTLGTLRSNVADSSNNEAYYAAESGINSAIDQLKLEVVSYYKAMGEASSSEFNVLFGSFATNINTNAQTMFVEPTLVSGSTSTTFYVGGYDSVNDVCEFNIQCISMTPDEAQYQVNATVYVKKIDISVTGGSLSVPDNAALVVGGELDLDYDSGIGINGGDVYVGSISFESTKKNKVPYSISGGDLYIDPSVGASLEDPYVFPSYSDPSMSSPNFVATTDTTINWANVPPSPVAITTLPGVQLTLDCDIDSGVIHGKGDVIVTSGSYDADLYVDGNLTLGSCDFNGDIYVRGNFNGQNAVIRGNLIVDGNITWSSGYSVGDIQAGGFVDIRDASSVCSIAAVSDIYIESVGISAGLIYSSGNITIGDCAVSAVLYSYGDLVITGGMYVEGAIFAKEDFYFQNPGPYMNMGYDPEFVKSIIDEANINLFGGGGGGGTQPTLDASIFVSQEITPVGRVN